MAMDVEVASIYECYASKKELRDSIYHHCVALHKKVEPDVDELLHMAENATLQELSKLMIRRMEPDDQELYDKILLIAMHDFSFSTDSAKLIEEALFCPIENTLLPLLNKLIALGRVEAMDIPTFIRLVKNFCFAVAVLNISSFKMDLDAKQKGYAMLLSLLKPVG
ncbi:MAG: hypothetical protein FWE59_06190 [Oscillospiraceae bacterium]|nr:hypothetical protein [Oscillospiraceae bacterium]